MHYYVSRYVRLFLSFVFSPSSYTRASEVKIGVGREGVCEVEKPGTNGTCRRQKSRGLRRGLLSILGNKTRIIQSRVSPY